MRAKLLTKVCLYALAVFAATAVNAQSVQDWKDAANNKGPSSIVYSDLKREAEDAKRDQDKACGREFSCISDRFRGSAIVDAHKSLREQLKEVEASKSSGKMSDAQYREAIDRIEDSLSKRDAERQALIEDGKIRELGAAECATSRRKTMLVYQKYGERLSNAERDSANKDAVESIRKLQSATRDSIEEHVAPHDRASKDAANCRSAVESLHTLKKLKKGDLL
jgi:hypothetical protein